MRYKLFSEVILSHDLPDYKLKQGDVATVVEIIDDAKETGYILELFDNEGNTIDVIPVLESDITLPFAGAIVNYRPYQEAA